eukprot:4253362-Pleurochrysis_carterae.AAC.1
MDGIKQSVGIEQEVPRCIGIYPCRSRPRRKRCRIVAAATPVAAATAATTASMQVHHESRGGANESLDLRNSWSYAQQNILLAEDPEKMWTSRRIQ